ncbi:GPP34-domain-containing protein [Sistotremastrum niveocremeum HHB9708]|uniref:GPP34-domain-containing protein n=1 Tax=Sistotremastrum niveocremeum HHB9708 TaxID=1314777 RepID=A0A164Z2Y1_9AGAM|nr:GPP34-domain-containing protein [Sistotremastrum niveocremeum HHB9708]
MSSSTEGLSRRRVAPSTSGATSPATPRTHTPALEPSTPILSSNGHAGTALEGGSKVAYDPHEDDDSRNGTSTGPNGRKRLPTPRLTLMEEVLLVGLKDKLGYLSFWNDSISYALRGCIVLELALRGRVAVVNRPGRRSVNLCERLIEVIDERMTGETILDEALRMMRDRGKEGEKLSVVQWIDLMSGETWNVMKISYQLKQVRERLQKGLVDKGLLTTSKTNFLLFDMATHPCTPQGLSQKAAIINRINALLLSKTTAIPQTALGEEGTSGRVIRSIALSTASYAANVLEDAIGYSYSRGVGSNLAFEDKEEALTRCDDVLSAFSNFPFATPVASGSGSVAGGLGAGAKRRHAGGGGNSGREAIAELGREVTKELEAEFGEKWELSGEVVAAVFEVWGRMDSLL